MAMKRSELYRALKDAGVEFTRSYVTYTTEELQDAYDQLQAKLGQPVETPPEPPSQEEFNAAGFAQAYEQLLHSEDSQPEVEVEDGRVTTPAINIPRERDPEEFPGMRLNTREEFEVIRIDELGRHWFQEEVQKPAIPKARGRRVMKYDDPGVVKKKVIGQDGTTEEFEVAGSRRIPSEIKVTLPSYQVGIYQDPRFVFNEKQFFRTVTYGGREGFLLDDVEQYYGGRDLVPQECLPRIYVDTVLCYDIRKVIRQINTEYRQMQLTGKA